MLPVSPHPPLELRHVVSRNRRERELVPWSRARLDRTVAEFALRLGLTDALGPVVLALLVGGILTVLLEPPAQAQSSPVPIRTGVPTHSQSVSNLVRQTGPQEFAVGKVTIRAGDQTVHFPVEINQRSNLVEYAVVHRSGKIHESILRTDVDPLHIHLAMLLLKVQPAEVMTLGGDPGATVPGQRIRIEIRWRESGQEVRRRLEHMVVYTTNTQVTLPITTWSYNGSYVQGGRFMASTEGSIVSLQEDATALINNPLLSRFRDDLHVVNSQALPPDGVSLEAVILVAIEKPK
jgi:hypothetical protein